MATRTQPGTFAHAVRRVLDVLGAKRAGHAAGVSDTRARQLANPNRTDAQVFDVGVAFDVACARAGFGTPLYDLWTERLAAAGVLAPARGRGFAIEATVRATIAAVRSALDALDRTLAGPVFAPGIGPGPRAPQLCAVRS